MINTLRDFLNKYNIKNKKVLIGFSSGPDSCALTRLLIELKEEFNLDITLAYFNHMWRKEAKSEEGFTENFAEMYNLNYVIGKAPSGIPCNEEIARELRYEFLSDCALKLNTDTIFLAHNKNDNVETLIYRVLKGTSVKGLCSIPEVRDIYYRPLLKIEKGEILKYLDSINQKYMVDISNDDTKYKRNFIRKELIPLFEKVNPNYMNAIDNLITTSSFASKVLQNAITEVMLKVEKNGIIQRDKYLSYGIEYRYEIINLFVGEKLKYRDFKTIKKLDDFIVENEHSRISLNKTEFLRTRRNKIFIENIEDIKG